MAAEEFVTKNECDRSHVALARENDRSNQTVTTALAGLTTNVGKLWDSLELLQHNFRNHVPPWTAAIMTLEALLLGIFGALAVKGL